MWASIIVSRAHRRHLQCIHYLYYYFSFTTKYFPPVKFSTTQNTRWMQHGSKFNTRDHLCSFPWELRTARLKAAHIISRAVYSHAESDCGLLTVNSWMVYSCSRFTAFTIVPSHSRKEDPALTFAFPAHGHFFRCSTRVTTVTPYMVKMTIYGSQLDRPFNGRLKIASLSGHVRG